MTTWINDPIKALDEQAKQTAIARQQQLTKPLGALGQLETIAINLAAMQGRAPRIKQPNICVFAADHGIAASGVSAFPQEVTAQMVANFANGGAAISVLAKALNAPFNIVNLGTLSRTDFGGVDNEIIAAGTRNMLNERAMSAQQCADAMNVGRKYVLLAKQRGCDLFIGGEMGIGNTSSATAIAAVVSGYSVAQLTGAGTGLDQAGITNKVHIIEQVLAKHQLDCPVDQPSALALLQTLGGFEIAALVGSYLCAAQSGITVLVDGFICTAAAMVTIAIAPQSKQWMIFSHSSAESGHALMLKHLQVTAVLDLQLRLGEGSGAALCVPLIQMACQLHNQMATFAQAAVAGKVSNERDNEPL